MNFARLSASQLDALREISNIGMGHAATALSQLTGDRVELRVPRVTITEIAQVPELIGGAEREVVGVTLRILGDARGNILLIFPLESARQLLTRLLGAAAAKETFDEVATSTLKEVGNILASAYLNALGSLLHLTMIPSIPLLARDMAGAVVDAVLIELSQEGDLALTVETEFCGEVPGQPVIRGHFFLLPDAASLQVVFGAIGGVA